MQTRPLGTTGLEVPILSFGASSLGQEFRKITIDEAYVNKYLNELTENEDLSRYIL